MSIKLTASQFENGLQTYTQFYLSVMLWINDLTIFPNPFTVAAVKAALDAGQLQPFDVENFNEFLTNVYTLELDTTALNLSERTRLNIIREYLEPPPGINCCGVSTPTALNSVVKPFKKIGSATFEYELQVRFDLDVTCAAYTIQATIAPQFGSPAVMVSPVVLNNLGCIESKRVFSFLWIDFAADPSGFNYDFDLLVKDNLGATITNYTILGINFP